MQHLFHIKSAFLRIFTHMFNSIFCPIVEKMEVFLSERKKMLVSDLIPLECCVKKNEKKKKKT